MLCITRQIRLGLALTAILLGAHLPGIAQVRIFSFSERGRTFLSAPTLWYATASPQRQSIGGNATESPTWAYAGQRFAGLQLGGQYFIKGFSLGYTLAGGATPKAEITPPGSEFVNRSRDYMADAQLQLGFIVLRSNTFCVIPTYGFGYGMWFSHYQQLAIPDPVTNQVRHEDREAGLFTGHKVHDMGLQLLYTLYPRPDGGSRFAIGVKGGYKQYAGSTSASTGAQTYKVTDDPIGTRGWYVQVGLGVGLVWDKYMVKPRAID